MHFYDFQRVGEELKEIPLDPEMRLVEGLGGIFEAFLPCARMVERR